MKFTDSHCHLDFDEFNEHRAQLLENCRKENINTIIVPAVSPNNWEKVIAMANCVAQHPDTNPNIYPCAGIHPWFLDELNDNDLMKLSHFVNQHANQLVAIGEAGIDGVIAAEQNNLHKQQHFFSFQLALAKEHELPIIVHHRNSHQHIFPLLKAQKIEKGGIIHAFSGSYQQATSYIDLGFKLGIGGTITYDRAIKTINTIKRVPLSSLLLETDAPAMPLSGHQGEVNTPLHLLEVFKRLVEIRSEPAEQIAMQLEKNCQSLFDVSNLKP